MMNIYEVYTVDMSFVGYFEAESAEAAIGIAAKDQPGLSEAGFYVREKADSSTLPQ